MKWKENYGGYDNPDRSKRGADYAPVAFVPNQNPFYIALPYQDIMAGAKTKSEARTVIPWFRQLYQRPGKTVLKGVWLAIRYKNKTCYAQWEDVGPFLTDDWKYVFGDARPRNHKNNGAGLDISPAVRDYLGIPGTMKVKCDWRFVRLSEIPPGPWQRYGANNHFVMNRDVQKEDEQQRLAELKRLRDAWFKKNNS